MARNELFGIDVEEKKVKFDERVEKKEEKIKIGEVRISNKLTFKTGDDAEIKEFLKKVIDTKDYDEEFKLIVNEWIERKIEKTGECAADEILFAHRYKNNLEGHDKNSLTTRRTGSSYTDSKYYFITNYCMKYPIYTYECFKGFDGNTKISKYEGKIPIQCRVRKISLEKKDSGIKLEINNNIIYSGYSIMGTSDSELGYVSAQNNVEYLRFKFITKDDINKLLNDLLEMTKLVITERNSNNNVVDDFFG